MRSKQAKNSLNQLFTPSLKLTSQRVETPMIQANQASPAIREGLEAPAGRRRR